MTTWKPAELWCCTAVIRKSIDFILTSHPETEESDSLFQPMIKLATGTVFWFYLANALFSEPISPYRSAYFQPQKEEEYAQAWNVFFYNETVTAQITFVIGNLGPGSLNNGYVIFVRGNNQNVTFIKESSSRGLKTEEGKLHYTFNTVNSIKENSNRSISAAAKSDTSFFQIEIHPDSLTRSIKLKSDFDEKFEFNEQLLTLTNQAKFTIKHNNKITSFSGWGGAEYIHFNKFPDHFAESIIFAKSIHGRSSLVVMGFRGNDQYRKKQKLTYIYSVNNSIVSTGNLINMKWENGENNTGIVPEKIIFSIEDRPACQLTLANKQPSGKLEILHNISPFLRWIVSFFFIDSKIRYYITNLTFKCDGIFYSNTGRSKYILLKDAFQ